MSLISNNIVKYNQFISFKIYIVLHAKYFPFSQEEEIVKI